MENKVKTPKERAEDRMTDGGIFMIGNEVIYDGEGERYGPRKIVRKDAKLKWPDVDE